MHETRFIIFLNVRANILCVNNRASEVKQPSCIWCLQKKVTIVSSWPGLLGEREWLIGFHIKTFNHIMIYLLMIY